MFFILVLIISTLVFSVPALGSEIYDVCTSGTPREIQAFFERGGDINNRDSADYTPIMTAAEYNLNPEVIRVLLRIGANINDKDKEKMLTTLHVASSFNPNPEVVQTLIEGGADINARDKYDCTPLMLAATNCQIPGIITALIRAGADVNAGDKEYNTTSLMRAAAYNQNPKIISTLIELGAKVDAPDKNGMTALLYAAAFGNRNPKVLKALLDAGADVNASVPNGDTPLSIAIQKTKNPQIIKVLLEYGSNTTWKTATGMNLLDIARENPALQDTYTLQLLEDAMSRHMTFQPTPTFPPSVSPTPLPQVNEFRDPQGRFTVRIPAGITKGREWPNIVEYDTPHGGKLYLLVSDLPQTMNLFFEDLKKKQGLLQGQPVVFQSHGVFGTMEVYTMVGSFQESDGKNYVSFLVTYGHPEFTQVIIVPLEFYTQVQEWLTALVTDVEFNITLPSPTIITPTPLSTIPPFPSPSPLPTPTPSETLPPLD